MKFIHLSDLHLGKRVNEYSMLEDQEYILAQITDIIDREKPDGVLIAGDVYDKSVPSTEAVTLLDNFLVGLNDRKVPVFLISGNHDSPERLDFGSRIMEKTGVHIAAVYDGDVKPYVLQDEYGDVNIYMLPFVKPANVRRFFPDEEIVSYTDCVNTAIKHMNLDYSKRNILVTHQFVTGATKSDSEDISVGGSDNVDSWVFDGFDYVALGHIHGPQTVGGRENIRYCGTPLKYSFSEAEQEKSLCVAELGEKGDVKVRLIPLTPMRDMRQIEGAYDEVTLRNYYTDASFRNAYLRVTLTDEHEILDAMAKLRIIYPYIMRLEYSNLKGPGNKKKKKKIKEMSPFEIFSDFMLEQYGIELNDEQADYMKDLIEAVKEGEE